jgi:hypothetical protein
MHRCIWRKNRVIIFCLRQINQKVLRNFGSNETGAYLFIRNTYRSLLEFISPQRKLHISYPAGTHFYKSQATNIIRWTFRCIFHPRREIICRLTMIHLRDPNQLSLAFDTSFTINLRFAYTSFIVEQIVSFICVVSMIYRAKNVLGLSSNKTYQTKNKQVENRILNEEAEK